MILDTLAQWPRYQHLAPRLDLAFRFLETLPANQPLGRFELDGDRCFALVQTYTTRPVADGKFETHQQYLDIQFIQAGRETILWAPLATLTHVTQPYAPEKDIAFFANPPDCTPLRLAAGWFAILFPADGHAPCLEWDAPAIVRKVVIKVRV